MPIRLLPPEVAGQIAAGEVVERPASVVKELIENSIDAAATDIRVEISEGGQRLIRVADNGCGIPAEEVAMAFARHATSKLTCVADLERITTLGFRGEALASIAAVSQVTLLTRPASQAAGQFLRVETGQIVRQESRACPAGTIVTVEHLFRNVPARLKFLRQPQTETGHIYRVVTHYAMAFPHLRFSLIADGRLAFQSAGNGQLRDVLLAVYGLDTVEQMIELSQEEDASSPPLSVLGLIGSPSLHRATRDSLAFFVNRRWVQDRSLSHAVAEAYHTFLPTGRHPVAVVLLEMDAAEVDVNVHPTKREVKFRNPQRVFTTVQRTVRHTLINRARESVTAFSSRTWPSPEWQRHRTLFPSEQEPFTTSHPAALEWYRTDNDDRASGFHPDQEPQPVGPIRLPLLRVVGQVGGTYIVAEGPQGMYLIDQHAAHERVLYEQMLADYRRQEVASQTLLEPLLFDLDPLLAGVLTEHLTTLHGAGFLIEPFGGTSFLLRAVPSILAVPDVRTALLDILELMHQNDRPLADQVENRLMAAICKRAAVKAGQTLSYEEMDHLVRRLEQCESPRTCPHGRPTILHFSVEQLEKEFGRR